MSFKLNPTIKEINKYLNQVADELLVKYGKVSNPEFEKELLERTGIAWKQVKNYRNHPKPRQRIRDNAKVLSFVLDCRKKDKKRKALMISATTFGGIICMAILFLIGKAVLFPSKTVVVVHKDDSGKNIEVRQIPNATTFRVPGKDWVLSVGVPSKDQIDLSQFSCKRYLLVLKTCRFTFNDGKEHLEIVLVFRGEFLQSYNLTSNVLGGFYPQEIFSQLKKKPFFDSKRNKVQNVVRGVTQTEALTDGETIDFMVSKHGPEGSVNAVSVSVSAKLWP